VIGDRTDMKRNLYVRSGKRMIAVQMRVVCCEWVVIHHSLWGLMYVMYEGWNFNSGNYLFTTDTK